MNKQNQIQITSKVLRATFIAFAVLDILGFFIAWQQYPTPIFDEMGRLAIQYMPEVPVMTSLPWYSLLSAFILSLIPLALSTVTLYKLARFFDFFSKKLYFELASIECLKTASMFLFSKELLNPFYEAAMSALLTWHNPPGHGLIVISMSANNIYNLIIATVALCFTKVLFEAHQLKNEAALTV